MTAQRLAGFILALTAGVGLALYAYHRVTDPAPTIQRQQEEAIVLAARDILRDYVAVSGQLEIVDPLAKNRVAGKVYIYPAEDGWAVSGHYRRAPAAHWRPWLMALDASGTLVLLKVQDDDPLVLARAASDPRFSAATRP